MVGLCFVGVAARGLLRVLDGQSHFSRYSASLLSKRLRRAGEIAPIEPITVLRGSTARNRNLISEAECRPVAA